MSSKKPISKIVLNVQNVFPLKNTNSKNVHVFMKDSCGDLFWWTYRPVARLGEAPREGADAVGHVRPSPPGIKMHEDVWRQEAHDQNGGGNQSCCPSVKTCRTLVERNMSLLVPLMYFSFAGRSTWLVALTIAMSSCCCKERLQYS